MFSALLKELRAQKGLTQGQLAKMIGVSPGNVGDWETGKSKPGYNALSALTRIFEVSADRLLEIQSPENASGDRPLCDGVPLSQIEADMVAMFRLLPEDARKQVFDFVYFNYKQLVEDKKDSIYSTYFDESKEQSGPAEGREAQGGTA